MYSGEKHYAEISQEMIDEWVDERVDAYLSRMGFDLTREIECHAKIERGGAALTRCYTQKEDAPLKQTSYPPKVGEQAPSKPPIPKEPKTVERPAYLTNLTTEE